MYTGEMKEPLDTRLSLERVRGQDLRGVQERAERWLIDNGQNPWPIFNLDARAYIDSFAKVFPGIAELPDRLAAFHLAGDQVVVVDLCGVANGKTIGADHSIGLTLAAPGDAAPAREDQTIVVGDVFTSGTIERVREAIEAHGGRFHCLFLRPVGGLGGYGHQMRAHLRLYSALARLYPLLAPDGEIFIDLRSFPGSALLAEAVNAQSTAPIAESVTLTPDSAPAMTLIHIKKTADAPQTLYTIDELRTIPDLEARFKEVLDSE
jgi:hypothetical protein